MNPVSFVVYQEEFMQHPVYLIPCFVHLHYCHYHHHYHHHHLSTFTLVKPDKTLVYPDTKLAKYMEYKIGNWRIPHCKQY